MSDETKKIDDGGPAFPSHPYAGCSTGMSLRDWFAGMAMLGLLNSTAVDTQSTALHITSLETGQSHDALIASRSLDLADALLAARRPKEETKP